MTEAELCHTNGWKVGDVLEGYTGLPDPIRIRITAIGRRKMLAVKVSKSGEDETYESTWSLQCRPWRKVGEA